MRDMLTFFQISKDLDIRSDILARELKILIEEKTYVILYEDRSYSLTSEGERELKQLKGEYKIPEKNHLEGK